MLHPDIFTAVGGYSPVIYRGYANDPLLLTRQLNIQSLDTLHIALDVGAQDSLAYDTRQFAQILAIRGFNVMLTVGMGGHDRDTVGIINVSAPSTHLLGSFERLAAEADINYGPTRP